MKKLLIPLMMIPLLSGCSASITGDTYKDLKENEYLCIWYGNENYVTTYYYSEQNQVTNIKYKIEHANACVDIYVRVTYGVSSEKLKKTYIYGGTNVSYMIGER